MHSKARRNRYVLPLLQEKNIHTDIRVLWCRKKERKRSPI